MKIDLVGEKNRGDAKHEKRTDGQRHHELDERQTEGPRGGALQVAGSSFAQSARHGVITAVRLTICCTFDRVREPSVLSVSSNWRSVQFTWTEYSLRVEGEMALQAGVLVGHGGGHDVGGTVRMAEDASISGLFGDYGLAAYNAAKGGVVNYTRTAAIDGIGTQVLVGGRRVRTHRIEDFSGDVHGLGAEIGALVGLQAQHLHAHHAEQANEQDQHAHEDLDERETALGLRRNVRQRV